MNKTRLLPRSRFFYTLIIKNTEARGEGKGLFCSKLDLTHREENGGAGYEYELGSLAYWYEGPSIALIYKASRDQTVVPVVPIGKITSDVSVFEEYGDAIIIELEETEEKQGMAASGS